MFIGHILNCCSSTLKVYQVFINANLLFRHITKSKLLTKLFYYYYYCKTDWSIKKQTLVNISEKNGVLWDKSFKLLLLINPIFTTAAKNTRNSFRFVRYHLWKQELFGIVPFATRTYFQEDSLVNINFLKVDNHLNYFWF